MTLILCADESNGLLFNNRRLSRDSILCQWIMQFCGDKPLWMNSYSASIFPPNASNIRISENFPEEMDEGEVCFVENTDIQAIIPQIKTVVLYRWNRKYPSDAKLPEKLLSGKQLVSTVDFEGSSHPCITQEVYE